MFHEDIPRVPLTLFVLFLVSQSCPTLCDLMDCSPPGSSVHGDSPGKNTGVGCHAFLQGDPPNPGTEPRSPTLPVDSLPSESPGKPVPHSTETQKHSNCRKWEDNMCYLSTELCYHVQLLELPFFFFAWISWINAFVFHCT